LGNAAVREIPAGCTSASCTVTVMSGLYWPTAVAVDGAGNLFVTESGYGNVKKIPLGCKSPSCMETVGSGFNQPYGLAVDSSGNVFVADTFNNAIKEVMAAGGYTTIKTLASGLDLPWSVVVNASGDLFVAEGGDQCTPFIPGSCSQINTSLVEITAASGYQTVTTLAGGIFGKPFGLAIDGGGNVYEADYGDTCATEYTAGSSYTTAHRLCSTLWLLYPEGLAVDSAGNLYLDDVIRGAVYKLDFADVPTITFKTATLKGVADGQDGPQVVSVQNNGTVPLTFTAISLSDSSFQFNSTLTTCSASTPLAVGSSCDLAVNFLPTTTGPLPGTLTLTDNNLNQSPATQVIQIVAVALPPTPVILTNPATSTTATSATFTFSDTQTPITFVCSIDSLPFSACSSPIAYSTLGGGPHAFQVKARDLAGNLSLAAVYNWTVNSVGPPAPVITSAPAYLTNDDTAAFSFTDTQAGVSYQCSLDGAAFTACTSGVSYSGLAPGGPTYYLNVLHHSFAVKAMDASNNFSPETTRAWTAASFTFSAYPVDFGLVPVGQTSSAQSITFNIGTAFTVATIDAVTMGVTGLDFTVSDPGTCAVGMALAKGSTCTLKATFTPRYPGQRKGAVLLLDSSGNGIGEAYLQGTGTAPQVTFGPYSTIFYNILAPQNNSDPGKNLYAPVSDVAVDGAGNVYAADMLIASSDGSIAVSTGDIWKFPAGCTGPTCSTLVATERNTVESAGIPLILPIGMTMDGAGNLWVDNYYLWPEGLATVGVWNTSQCSYIGGYSSYYFMRTAVDGAGDAALLGNGLLQNCYQNLGVGQTTQTTSFDFSGNTPSLTVDPAGNYFVADSGNNAIKEVVASSNYTISRAVGSGFSGPNGVASDAYGNIYVSDTGNNALKEIVAASGYTQVLTLATFDPKSITPENLTVDALGNVYIALANVTQTGFNSSLTNQFVKLDFSDAPALNFPTATKIGTTDTADGTLTATVKNTGNQPLTIGGLALSNTNFMIDAGATTCSASAPLAMGGSCTIGVVFTPNATGSLTGMLTLTDNALNASGTTQQFALTGTGYTTPTTSAPTVAVAPASGSITTAQSDSVTVTVSGASGKPTPTGTVSLIGGSYISAAVTLSGGSASFTIPAGILAVGSTTMNAVYTPDTASSTTYGTGAGSATISVTAVSTSTPTVSVTPAAIDISTQQSLAVTISVSGGSGNPTPTGSVTLSGGNYASLATVLGNGSATITIPAGYLPAGPVDLTAYYTPDPAGQANYTSASGTGQVAVQAAAKSTPPVTVIPASASIAANRPLQVTIQVSGGNGKSAPTGSVVLSSGSYVSATAVLSQGNVSVSIPADALAAGTDTLTASYTPDNTSSLTFNSATGSGTVTVSTPVFSTLTTLQASAATISIGSSITFTAAVAESSGTAIPSGTVTFIDGATALGTGTLNGAGSAAFITSSLALGAHSITAVYAGDSGNSGSTSAALIVTVNPLTAQAINFTQPTSPVTYSSGLQIPLVATGGASGNPVVFTLDASSTATGSINANTLTVTSIGTLVIDANQTGNSNYSAAAQVQRTVVVNALIAQTINFTQPTSPVVYTSGLQIALSATGGASGNPVVFTLDASSTATGSITGNTLTVNGAGNLVIDANQAGNANYSSAPQVQRTVVVTSDFSISVTPPAQSIQRGASAQYTITLAAAGGSFNNTVTLSATGLPAGATGAFSPPTLTPGSGSGTSTLTVQTAASAGMARPNLWPLSTPVLALIFLLPLRRWRRVLGGKVLLLVAGLASLSCAIALTGCGGGWAGTPQSQSYTLTITANSGSDTHSTTVQLTVQ
jgi:sugar lactone lactonase YvrE